MSKLDTEGVEILDTENKRDKALPSPKELLSDILAISGAVAVTVGVGLLSLPGGFITGGLCAIAIAWTIVRNG